MTEEQAFLADIVAHPEEDAPRLIYADWLEEHGKAEWGEFIRVQCERARLGNKHLPFTVRAIDWEKIDQYLTPGAEISTRACDCRWCRLKRREEELASGIATFNSDFPFPIGGYWLWRRGFIEVLCCTAEEWLTHHERATARMPLREVRLTTLPQIAMNERKYHFDRVEFNFLAACPFLPHWFKMSPSDYEAARNGSLNLEAYVTSMLLSLNWPRITFTLPEYGESRLRRAFQPRLEDRYIASFGGISLGESFDV